jgi:hypothetical protein
MGLFPLAATISMDSPPRWRMAREWWRNLFWRPPTTIVQPNLTQYAVPPDPSRLLCSESHSQFRAIPQQPRDRASQCIQRAPLSRRSTRIATTLRRWMLPIVERGPPVT